ncbi:MAG: magnesium and cobalt transport protein CorA [Thermoleophilia bacterium]|nr:magnesium and cobalt transport protein CorA [Thermoleophilia bacterium]
MGADVFLPVLDTLDSDRIAELRRRDEFFWLDLESPTREELEDLAACMGLHELAIEDAENFDQRPKLDEYGDHAALVYYGVADVGGRSRSLELLEVHVFVHGDGVVTVRRAPWPDSVALRETFQRVPLGSEQLVVYRILDTLTDSFFPLVERIDAEIEQLEQAVVADPQPEHIQHVMRLKRDLASLRRTVGPMRDVAGVAVTRLAEIPGLANGPRDYFRDVYDHMLRIERAFDSSRVLLSDVLSVHSARVAHHQGKSTERLTLVSTIFLPLSFVVGFFGQNFQWMVDAVKTRNDFLVFGIGGMVASVLILIPLIGRSALRGDRLPAIPDR